MCGIVGYVGHRSSVDVLVSGLSRLEYRGYDSAGIATVGIDGVLALRKRSGKLEALRTALAADPMGEASVGIAHTRWATHGAPTDENAHPHLADDGSLALIHNGIVENYGALKAELVAAGHVFHSQTDSEVAAILLGQAYREHGRDLVSALRSVVTELQGAFTLVAVHQDHPEIVVAARKNSPLVVGLGDGENFLASDVAAFVEYTDHALAVGEEQIVVVSRDSVDIIDFAGAEVEAEPFRITWDAAAADKGGWSSFMAKEIAEEPEAVANTLRGRVQKGQVVIPELSEAGEDLPGVSRIVIVACGTASYAGQVAKYAFEGWSQIPVAVELAHEFRYRDPVLDSSTLVVSISQSGETMDTLMAIKYANERGARTVSICNTQGATIPRESHYVVYTHAGPEIAVASTKAFVAQITALYLLALHLGALRGTIDEEHVRAAARELEALPTKIRRILDEEQSTIEQLAHWMADTHSVLFLGRHVGFPVALEGALKLKEITYIHAEGFAAGELKHGPIALIEPGHPVFVIVPSPRSAPLVHAKVVSNIQEIRARGARVIAIAEEGDESRTGSR